MPKNVETFLDTENFFEFSCVKKVIFFEHVKSGHRDVIERTEVEILTNPTNYRLHEALTHEGKGKFSARVSKNLRIVYQVDGETITLEKIGTHDEVY